MTGSSPDTFCLSSLAIALAKDSDDSGQITSTEDVPNACTDNALTLRRLGDLVSGQWILTVVMVTENDC